MEHFRRVLADIDPAPFLAEVAAVDDAFALQTGRQRIRVQREALAIPMRGIRQSRRGGRARRDVHASRWTGLSARLPITREFLEWFAAREDGLLGRAPARERSACARGRSGGSTTSSSTKPATTATRTGST